MQKKIICGKNSKTEATKKKKIRAKVVENTANLAGNKGKEKPIGTKEFANEKTEVTEKNSKADT